MSEEKRDGGWSEEEREMEGGVRRRDMEDV